VSDPVTATLGGVDMRVAGGPTDDFYVVVAQSLDTVSQARSTLILAEVIIAPILLAIVFLGAVAIGRRVAAPIDLARRRQLEFTADASHELRTPLSVIEAETSLALGRDRDAEWYRGAFGRVDRESKRMHRLVDDLLWLARFDATRGLPDGEPVDLGVPATEAVDRFHSVAEARRLSSPSTSRPVRRS
jgi:signal transduction histidine kinase